MRTAKLRCFELLIALFVITSPAAAQTFTNPLLPSGADPWIVRDGGFYYLTVTTAKNLTIRKAKSLAAL